MMFHESLFDFDFESEKDVRQAIEEREAHRLSLLGDGEPEPPAELAETVSDTLGRLRGLAADALDSGRMGAYFRLLDEIERWEGAICLDA